MKTPLPTPDCPDSDGTLYRILAFLASMKPITGHSSDEDFERGRAIIERMAMSAAGFGSPDICLAPDHCADVLQFLAFIEPLEASTWWSDPAHGPSHLVGFQFVLQTLRANLRIEEDQSWLPVWIKGDVGVCRLLRGLASVGLTMRLDQENNCVVIEDVRTREEMP